jgi:DNA-binding transcriptional ArsR family regulator
MPDPQMSRWMSRARLAMSRSTNPALQAERPLLILRKPEERWSMCQPASYLALEHILNDADTWPVGLRWPVLPSGVGTMQIEQTFDAGEDARRDSLCESPVSQLSVMEGKADEAARLLSALGQTKRLMALCRLMDTEMSVGALAESVGLGNSALSQHLARLRDLGIVATRRDGQTIYYRLASEDAKRLISVLYDIYCK